MFSGRSNRLQGIDVPFDDKVDQWLTAVYKENDCRFDFVSAGSGFLQVISILSFLLLHTSRVALLDEPDSHMHDDLQRVTFEMLERLGRERSIQLIIATHSPTLVDAAGLERVLLIDRSEKTPLAAHDVERLIPLLGDRGLALPPTKVMNALRSRRAVFVEGEEDDYDRFLKHFGERLYPGYSVDTRGLIVFQTKGATKKWPFDAIACFEELLGVRLRYIVLFDRDFLTDDDITKTQETALQQSFATMHWQRRNRESYLLEPAVLERLLRTRWTRKHSAEPFPEELTASHIKAFILDVAKENESETLSSLLVEHEPALRGDADHRKAGTLALNSYFKESYRDPIERGEVPYKLLDGKAALARVREHIAQRFSISFSDADIIDEFQPQEVPVEVRQAVSQIRDMFDVPRRPEQSQLFGV
jgi:energy-coupling factor transporter ATP-binding protein EcfA2